MPRTDQNCTQLRISRLVFRSQRFVQLLLPKSLCLALMTAMLPLGGCADRDARVSSGAITISGDEAEMGRIFFVPVEGTRGPRSSATIANGNYEVADSDGLQQGRYRVVLDVSKRTGRKTRRPVVGGELAEVDETIPVGPSEYRGDDSPLIIDTADGKEGVLDIAVPAK